MFHHSDILFHTSDQPVAWCISDKENTDVIEVFLRSVKDRSPETVINVIMTDDGMICSWNFYYFVYQNSEYWMECLQLCVWKSLSPSLPLACWQVHVWWLLTSITCKLRCRSWKNHLCMIKNDEHKIAIIPVIIHFTWRALCWDISEFNWWFSDVLVWKRARICEIFSWTTI